MCQCCVLSEHNLWCAVIVCVLQCYQSVWNVCSVDNVCVVNMWSVCLLGVWGARSVWGVWSVCVFGVHVRFELAHDGSFTQARARSNDPNLIMENRAQEQGT